MNKKIIYIPIGSFLFGGLFLFLISFVDFWLLDTRMFYGAMDLNEWFGDPYTSYVIWSVIWAVLGGISGYGKYKNNKITFILPIILFILVNIIAPPVMLVLSFSGSGPFGL